MKKKISRLLIDGLVLAKYRENAGYTQEELAQALGINRVTLAQWERKGRVKIDEKQAESLKNLLKVEINVLTNVSHGTTEQYILDHPFIKAMTEQSKYIMDRVHKLEEENERLRGNKNNK